MSDKVLFELIPAGGGQAIPLARGRHLAGSGPDVAVILGGPQVADQHLVITVTGDRIFCQARAAQHSFRINGQECTSGALMPGDELELSGQTYELRPRQAEGKRPPSESGEIIHNRAAQTTLTSEYQRARLGGSPTELLGQMDVMYRLAKLVGSVTDRQQFAEDLLDLVLEVLPVDRAVLVRFGQDGAKTSLEASRPTGAAHSLYAVSETVLQKIHKDGCALITSDALHDHRLKGSQSISALSIRRVICAPLVRDERPWGALYADGRGDGEPLRGDHLALLESIASHAEVALERSSLYQSLQERELHTHLLVHDMKNPMASILGGLQLLEITMTPQAPETQVRTLRLINQAADQLNGYISDIMDVAQLEERLLRPRRQDQDLDGLLVQLRERWEPNLTFHDRPLTLTCTVGACFPMDPRLINRVLDNLVDNALHYAPRGSEIKLFLMAGERELRITVQDGGQGVPREARQRIFEKFGRAAKARSGGRGLGLYFCRLAVEAHGGSIHVEGEPGDNRFVVCLPRPDQGATESQELALD